MKPQDMIDVIQAHIDGKDIQYTSSATTVWTQASEPCWDFSIFKYRVKPEPREFIICDGEICTNDCRDDGGGAYTLCKNPEAFKVREVL